MYTFFFSIPVEGYPYPTNNEVQSQGNYNMMNPPMRPYYYQNPQYYYPMSWYPQRGSQVPHQQMPQQNWFNPNPWYANTYPSADQNETSTTDQSEMVCTT